MKEKLMVRHKEMLNTIQQQSNHVQQLTNALNGANEKLIAMKGALSMLEELIESENDNEPKPIKSDKNE